MLQQGLYEQLLYHALSEQLEKSQAAVVSYTEELDKAESSKVIAQYLSEIIEHSLNDVGSIPKQTDDERIRRKIRIANKIVR